MDALAWTIVSTAVLAVLVPMDWYVAKRYFEAWRGGESIRYFAPTMALIVAVAVAASSTLLVAVLVLATRLTGTPLLPPGIGLLLITIGLFVPSAVMPWFLRLLRSRK